jgi:outer membrane lipoprotein-sorting protein
MKDVRLALAVAVLVPPVLGAQEGRALPILEDASARYERMSSLCADFSQRLEVTLLGDERSGAGRMCQARPDRFAMRFTEPAGDLVVLDGSSVWLYYPSLDEKQVIQLPVTATAGGFDLYREFLERPAEKYEATYETEEAVAGHATYRIRLVPRAPTSYDGAVVWIDRAGGLLRQVRVEEENGTVRTVTLRNIEIDPQVPEGWFVFTPPPGAQVIRR